MQGSLVEPSPERRKRDPITRSTVLSDVDGRISQPWRSQHGWIADKLFANDEITAAEYQAANAFAQLAFAGRYDPLRAADMARIAGARPKAIDNPPGAERARMAINDAIDALGGLSSPMASVVWHVLVCQDSLSKWAIRQRWTGHTANNTAAKGVLIAALGTLARYWRLEKRA